MGRVQSHSRRHLVIFEQLLVDRIQRGLIVNEQIHYVVPVLCRELLRRPFPILG